MSHRRPRSSAPSTVSNSASSPAAWPSVRLRPRARGPPAVAVHHAGDVDGAGASGSIPGGSTAANLAAAGYDTRACSNGGVARWRALDAVLRVTDRFGAVGGGPLSASIALSTFLSLFPLLLVGIAVIGFLSSGDDDVRSPARAATSGSRAAAAAGRHRRHLDGRGQPAGRDRSWASSACSGRGSGWSASLQTAINAVWQETGRGLIDRLVALRWLARRRRCCSSAAPPRARCSGSCPGWAAPLTVAPRPGA